MAEATSSNLQPKILKQVDYYFGDSNFPRDKFLRNKAKENPEGCIIIYLMPLFVYYLDLSYTSPYQFLPHLID